MLQHWGNARTNSSGSNKPTPSATAAAMSVIVRASIEPRHLLRDKICRVVDRRLATAGFQDAYADRMGAREPVQWNPGPSVLRCIPALMVHAPVIRRAYRPSNISGERATVDEPHNGVSVERN